MSNESTSKADAPETEPQQSIPRVVQYPDNFKDVLTAAQGHIDTLKKFEEMLTLYSRIEPDNPKEKNLRDRARAMYQNLQTSTKELSDFIVAHEEHHAESAWWTTSQSILNDQTPQQMIMRWRMSVLRNLGHISKLPIFQRPTSVDQQRLAAVAEELEAHMPIQLNGNFGNIQDHTASIQLLEEYKRQLDDFALSIENVLESEMQPGEFFTGWSAESKANWLQQFTSSIQKIADHPMWKETLFLPTAEQALAPELKQLLRIAEEEIDVRSRELGESRVRFNNIKHLREAVAAVKKKMEGQLECQKNDYDKKEEQRSLRIRRRRLFIYSAIGTLLAGAGCGAIWKWAISDKGPEPTPEDITHQEFKREFGVIRSDGKTIDVIINDDIPMHMAVVGVAVRKDDETKDFENVLSKDPQAILEQGHQFHIWPKKLSKPYASAKPLYVIVGLKKDGQWEWQLPYDPIQLQQ